MRDRAMTWCLGIFWVTPWFLVMEGRKFGPYLAIFCAASTGFVLMAYSGARK